MHECLVRISSQPIKSTIFHICRDGHVHAILQDISKAGFKAVRMRQYKLTYGTAVEFYKEHEGKAFFGNLIAFMTSGDIIAIELEKEDAIQEWRRLCGPTNTLKAKETAPESLRARFGTGAVSFLERNHLSL
jgi:nucleoside diphosphate kinase